VAAAALVSAGSAAWGAGEGELQVSARLGPETVSVDQRTPWGLAGALDAEYGFSDAWAGRVSVGGGLQSVDANPGAGQPGGTVRTTTALAGVTYTFDVLRLVPYLELGIGLLRFSGAVLQPRTTLAAELGVGGDYLLTRRWACGASFQYLIAPADLANNAFSFGSSPYAFSMTLRASRMF
jgi:hypothetical protein